ncbi:unnamed protein product [Wickerhamomyces anomalus]
MSGKVYFISGGNRGIGFQFVKQLSANPENTIIASARDPSKATELQNLVDSQENIKVVKLDVSDKASIDSLDAQLKDVAKDGIDVLISNAGIAQSFETAINTDQETYEKHYRTNVLGPIFLTKAVYPYLKLKETRHLVYISSLAGSIGAQIPFTTSAYGQSKAALNYSIKEISFELGPENFVAVALHPGMVKTDMGKAGIEWFSKNSPEVMEAFKQIPILSPEESAKAQLENVILKLNTDLNGKFLDYEGKEQIF